VRRDVSHYVFSLRDQVNEPKYYATAPDIFKNLAAKRLLCVFLSVHDALSFMGLFTIVMVFGYALVLAEVCGFQMFF
jgi:hypothetical protein